MADLKTPIPEPRIVRVVDIETTGTPEDAQHAICEIGWVDLDLSTLTIGNPATFLVNPGHPIPPHVRAIHHISDAMVAGAITPASAAAKMCVGLSLGDVLCAHNAEFEKAFLQVGRRWVCTLKAAYRAFPDFKAHNNQALRYELGLDDEPDFDSAAAMPPHRALPDAITTAHILRRLLAMRPLERLIEIETLPGYLPRMPFGEHYGKKFAEIPAGYLDWIVNKSGMPQDPKRADVVYTAKWWLERQGQ